MQDSEQKEIKKLKKKLKHQERKNAEIRDQLAMQRTIFANERTLMAYLRTAIATIGGGFAAIKLSQHVYMALIGFALMAIGLFLTTYSIYRYLQKQKLIRSQTQDYTHTSKQHAELQEKDPSGYGNTD